MASLTVTITDHTKRFNLAQLFRAPAGNSYAGATIVNFDKQAHVLVQYVTLQQDLLSAANYIYVGDKNVSATNFGIQVPRGDPMPLFPASGNTIRLSDLWVTCDIDGAIFHLLTQVM